MYLLKKIIHIQAMNLIMTIMGRYIDPILLCTSECIVTDIRAFLANTNHLYNICTTLYQLRRRWSNIVQMLYKMCFLGYMTFLFVFQFTDGYPRDQLLYVWKNGNQQSIVTAKDMRLSQFDLAGHPAWNFTVNNRSGEFYLTL